MAETIREQLKTGKKLKKAFKNSDPRLKDNRIGDNQTHYMLVIAIPSD